MSQYDDDDDFDDDIDGGITAVRKALRAAEKRAKALEQELSTYRTESRQRAMQAAIEAKGLNPKIAAFVPADVTTEQIGSWLDEYAEVFAPQGTAPQSQEPTPEPIIPDGADIFAQASTGPAPTGDESELLALIKGATSKADLDRLIFGQVL